MHTLIWGWYNFYYNFFFFRSKMWHNEWCKPMEVKWSSIVSWSFLLSKSITSSGGIFCFVFVLAISHGFPITIRPVAVETLKMSDNGSLSTVVFLYTYNSHKIAILQTHFPFYLIKKSHFFYHHTFYFFYNIIYYNSLWHKPLQRHYSAHKILKKSY